jgi:hypothetical protein
LKLDILAFTKNACQKQVVPEMKTWIEGGWQFFLSEITRRSRYSIGMMEVMFNNFYEKKEGVVNIVVTLIVWPQQQCVVN